MTERSAHILKKICDSYIETAQPVGSKMLSTCEDIGVSAATIRNEMRDLEQNGFLGHPHTSAGRIPTARGYRKYVDHLLEQSELEETVHMFFRKLAAATEDVIERRKLIAKFTGEYVQNAVIAELKPHSLYYTGLSSLFSQPEFTNHAYAVRISSLFDKSEEVLEDLSDRIDETPRVFIGNENPFGVSCSLAGVKMQSGEVFCVLGPIRMNYGVVLSLLRLVQKY